MRDPRGSAKYQRTRRAWLAGYQGGLGTCCLCGLPVDVSLPGNHRWGPTVEHRLPVRRIVAMSASFTEAVALACDTSTWALAHFHCQSRQGGASSSERECKPRMPMNASRQW